MLRSFQIACSLRGVVFCIYDCSVSCCAVAHDCKRSQSGWTVLMYAARVGLVECVRLLLDAGADKDAENNVRRRLLCHNCAGFVWSRLSFAQSSFSFGFVISAWRCLHFGFESPRRHQDFFSIFVTCRMARLLRILLYNGVNMPLLACLHSRCLYF
jgi:ankyrin repeat protein